MRAAGLELDLAVRVRAKALEHAIARDRLAAAFDDRHLGSLAPVPADRRVDGAAAREHAVAHRLIGAVNRAPLEVRGERLLARERARDEQQAARVLVEPMHEPRARQHRELGVRVQQRVLQRARAVARAGMHDEAHGLVDHEQRVVLVHDGERNRLGRDLDGRLELGLELELLAALEQRPGAGAAARDGQPPASIQVFSRLRENSGSSCAAAWSSRRPAKSAGTISRRSMRSMRPPGESETFGYTSSSKQANRHNYCPHYALGRAP